MTTIHTNHEILSDAQFYLKSRNYTAGDQRAAVLDFGGETVKAVFTVTKCRSCMVMLQNADGKRFVAIAPNTIQAFAHVERQAGIFVQNEQFEARKAVPTENRRETVVQLRKTIKPPHADFECTECGWTGTVADIHTDDIVGHCAACWSMDLRRLASMATAA